VLWAAHLAMMSNVQRKDKTFTLIYDHGYSFLMQLLGLDYLGWRDLAKYTRSLEDLLA
jgi:hypothetical protein